MASESEDLPDALESPDSESALYHARGNEVSRSRPLLTGDVLSDIEIPGLGDASGFAIVLTHPCTMRRDGVHLASRQFVARVRNYHEVVQLYKWSNYHKKVMPLPALGIAETPRAAAFFLEASLCNSNELTLDKRIACLSEVGINLLQQRLVFHLTRFVVPTFRLHEAAAQVFREIELHEEWLDDAAARGQDLEEAAAEFHEWIRAVPEGAVSDSRQARLNDPQQVAAVRRELRMLLAEGQASDRSAES